MFFSESKTGSTPNSRRLLLRALSLRPIPGQEPPQPTHVYLSLRPLPSMADASPPVVRLSEPSVRICIGSLFDARISEAIVEEGYFYM